MNEQRVILLCSSKFAVTALQELVFFKQLAAVVVPAQAEEMAAYVKHILTSTDIPQILVDKNSYEREITEAIRKYRITIGLIMTFSFRIPEAIFLLPPKGFFNVHPGPLPHYRGADPVFRQILNKEPMAGVSIHQLDNGYDTGPVVFTEKIKLDKNDTYGLLTGKLAHLAAGMVRTLLKLAAYDLKIPFRPQNESQAVYYRRQGGEEVTINWQQMDTDTIIALINACNPWNKGAVTKFNQQIVRLLFAEKVIPSQKSANIPGTITGITEEYISVNTLNGEILNVRFVSVDEGFFPAGRLIKMGIQPGSCFG
jgi:methionyl-tRNA formyltransferase